MEVDTIKWFIKNRLTRGHKEDETSRVWNEILHLEYSIDDGYTTGTEINLNGKADLFTAHLVAETRAKEYKFLVVECKAPGLETQDAIWDDAADQLADYLGSLAENNSKRIFGAIAVGKVVRFY